MNGVGEKARIGSHYAGGAAVLCAVHCVVTPALALVLPALAAPQLEIWALGSMVLLAGPLGTTGFVRHGRPGPILLIAAGIALWSASLGGILEPLPEPLASALGGLLTGGGLFWNARYLHERTHAR